MVREGFGWWQLERGRGGVGQREGADNLPNVNPTSHPSQTLVSHFMPNPIPHMTPTHRSSILNLHFPYPLTTPIPLAPVHSQPYLLHTTSFVPHSTLTLHTQPYPTQPTHNHSYQLTFPPHPNSYGMSHHL